MFADDAELVSDDPFPPGEHRGTEQLRRFLAGRFTQRVGVDPTRKQLAGDRVVWTLRARTEGPRSAPTGRAEAEVQDGRIMRLRVGR
ncbi:hypothetical protein [Pseudonocardia asaccharolytica]|uniref:hypothetical protein n=1 Tax=Pseudonocardia asaccharolytica TaxID=54010 RepID=UPI001FE1D87E|nr:hypothetical protein [Pseudonocardia asaccharolytica]